jgi:hypothetical protein
MQASLAGVALSKQSTFAGLRSPKGCLLPPFGEAGQRLSCGQKLQGYEKRLATAGLHEATAFPQMATGQWEARGPETTAKGAAFAYWATEK